MSKETNRNALAAYSTTEQVSPLAEFYKPGWEHYQQALVQTIAPLSSEQLALSLRTTSTIDRRASRAYDRCALQLVPPMDG